jgi:hypothetical protein
MNTHWLKRNPVVIISTVVFAVLLGLIIWVEQKAAVRKTAVEANLNGLQEKLKQLRGLDPYPSPENIQILKSNRAQILKLSLSMQEAIMQDPLKVPDVPNEIAFVDRLQKTQTELRSLANEHRVEIREDFAFGFSRYNDSFPCRSAALKPDDCRRTLALLSKQLLVVDKLAKLAISNNIDGIVSIRRTEVEPGVSANSSSDTFPGSIATDAKARYQKLPFEITFVSSEGALQSFLNSLSLSDWFFTVETVKVGSEIPDIRTSTQPGAPTDRIASKKYKQLLVNMRIDLVEFPNPKSKPTK